MILAYEEFVDFLARGTTPQSVIDFRPSDTTKTRVAELINRQKTTSLSPDETAELNQYLQVEHLMRLVKARARQRFGRRVVAMSVTYISAELRRLVVARAEGLCEYCLIAEEDTFYGCAVDHIISEKHGGPTAADNLGYACVFCNQAKGSDIGSIHWESGLFVRFFNPRTDRWADHFKLAGNQIEGVTVIGAVTARILGFNSAERLMERQTLQEMKRYPSAAASDRMREVEKGPLSAIEPPKLGTRE